MKKSLSLIGLAAFAFASCSFTSGEDSSLFPFSLSTVSTEEIVRNLPENHTAVLEGKLSGPCGDSQIIQLSRSAEAGGIPNLSHGNKYYISPDGIDKTDSGTKENPFKSFEYALKKLNPGDTLYVMTGRQKTPVTAHKSTLTCNSTSKGDITINDETVTVQADFTENIKIKNLNGNANSYITIASAPGNKEKPVISISKDSSDKKIVYIKNSSYIRLSGLALWASYGNGAEGVKFSDDYESDCNHIIIDNCDFRYINVGTKSNNGHGISMSGNSAKNSINNVLIYKNTFQYLLNGKSECVTAVGNCEYINIIGNQIDSTGNIGIDVGGNYGYCKDKNGDVCKEKDFVRYVYIAKNKVSNELSSYDQTAYAIYADGGQHIQIIGNTVSDCTGAFEVGAEEPCGAFPTSDVLILENKIKNSVTDKNLASRCHVFQIGGYDDDNDGYVRNVKLERNNVYIDAPIKSYVFDFSKCQSVLIVNNTFVATKNYNGYVFEHKEKAIVRNNTYTNILEEDD